MCGNLRGYNRPYRRKQPPRVLVDWSGFSLFAIWLCYSVSDDTRQFPLLKNTNPVSVEEVEVLALTEQMLAIDLSIGLTSGADRLHCIFVCD